MGSISSQPSAAGMSSSWKAGLKKVVLSRWTFVALQVLDLLTTLIAFRAGAVEVNPLVAHLTVLFGRVRGVVISKVIAVAIAMGVKKLIWVVFLRPMALVKKSKRPKSASQEKYPPRAQGCRHNTHTAEGKSVQSQCIH